MLIRIIAFFTHRHLLTNMIVMAVFIGAIVAWPRTPKEELPDFASPNIHVSISYPGATPSDVERLVTRKVEQELKGIDGVEEVRSTSTEGRCSITLEFQPGFADMDNALNDIRSAVNGVKLPAEIRDLPVIRRWKTSQKAIIDIGIYLENVKMLDTGSRIKLQDLAGALENRLTSLPEISEVNKNGYLKEEIQIILLPHRMRQYNISVSTVLTALKNNNIRQPAGSMNNHLDTKISLVAELDTVKKLQKLVIRSGFDAPAIRLSQLAMISTGFEKNTSITKINGREAVIFGVKKSSSADIITASRKVIASIKAFRKTLKGTAARMALLDDESSDVRNRLSLIGWNGLIGFSLVLITLLLLLDIRTGLWVAMGIPFTFCLAMIMIPVVGYTVNNVTLAAVIIVMGMIVDDAIVVAENISRKKSQGHSVTEASVKGTVEVCQPIMASIITTCVAFIPLYFFGGRFSVMTKYIPGVIFIMLFASLFESTLILPGHLTLYPGNADNTKKKRSKPEHEHWFFKVEAYYTRFLEKILRFRVLILLIFSGLLLFSATIGAGKLQFVMFPREESTQFGITGMTKSGTGRQETARILQTAEDILRKELGKDVVGFRTYISRSRRGGPVNQNQFFIRVEIVPKEQRKVSARSIRNRWLRAFRKVKGITRIRIRRSRWGQTSGSPIEVEIRGNSAKERSTTALAVEAALLKIKGISEVEIEEPFRQAEYQLSLKQEMVQRLGISAEQISSTIRTLLQGSVVYELSNRDEEVDVRVSIPEISKKNINHILSLPVQNKGNYLVPLRNLVIIKQLYSPTSIERKNYKQTLKVYADLKQDTKTTPLMVAEILEKNAFPALQAKFPGIAFKFGGEIKDTRESGGEMVMAVVLVLFLILGILMLLFNSLVRPLLIMLAIPFGTVGVILTFLLHGIYLIGFFTAIGVLGLAGVVVNDSIVMMDKLDKEFDKEPGTTIPKVARIAATRLRAVLLTTLTTVAGVMPTAYGIAGYDSMLAEMMMALSWGLLFGTLITLVLIPCSYSLLKDYQQWRKTRKTAPIPAPDPCKKPEERTAS